MAESLYALALLACPVGMGLMMWFMMRGGQHKAPASTTQASNQQAVALRAELDQLQAELRQTRADSSAPDRGNQPHG